MIEQAINRIVTLARKGNFQTFPDVHGKFFYVNEAGNMIRLKKPEEMKPDTFEFHTLSALAEFIGDAGGIINGDHLCIVIDGPESVRVFGELQPSNDQTRFQYASAKLIHNPFQFGQYIDLERFVIMMQTLFVQTFETAQVVDALGHMANETIVDNKDDGFSQTIQVKTGITEKSAVKIENPISLQPFRTFREVDQHEVPCVLRLRKAGSSGIESALFEAGGDTWKLGAVERIAEYFKDRTSIPVFA